jgi:oligosaccharide repeat unit polymerase
VLSAHALAVVALIVIWALVDIYAPDPQPTTRIVSVLFLVTTVWLFVSWRLVGRRIADPYGIFLITGVLFNGGQVCLEAFGLNRGGMLGGEFTPRTVLDVVLIVTVALSTLHLGALAAVSTTAEPQPGAATADSSGRRELWACRAVGTFLLLVAIVPAARAYTSSIKTVLSDGYAALYQQDAGTGLGGIDKILASLVIPGALFLLVGSRTSKRQRWIPTSIVAAFALLELFSGSRGHAAMFLIAYVWLHDRYVRPLPKSLLLAGAGVTLFVLFPLIREVRNVSGVDRTSLDFLTHAYLSIDNPVLSILSEMGASMSTLAYTLELVPATRRFEHGFGYLYALTSLLPNFFWDIHPAAAHMASDWLIWAVDPITARAGGGLGYSFVAEAYFNFGAAGVPFVMIAMGYCYCRFVLWADKPSRPARLAAIASFMAFALFYARGEFLFVIRPLVWYALMPYWTCLILTRAKLPWRGPMPHLGASRARV